MLPRRTHASNGVFGLEGGNEDNDLWVQNVNGTIRSVWVPTDEERLAIADGANIELVVHGQGHPPVNMNVVRIPLGKKPESA